MQPINRNIRPLFVCLGLALAGLIAGAQAPPTVTLTTAPNPSWVTEPATFTATIGGATSGTADFAVNGMVIGNAPVTAVGNLGNETFSAFNATINSVAAGDVTGDGLADVIYATGNGVFYRSWNSNGTIGNQISISSFGAASVAVADFDKNGKLDIVAGGLSNGDTRIYQGGANGTFTAGDVVNDIEGGVAVGDFNGDTWPDIVVTPLFSGSASVKVLRNASGSFDSFPPTTLSGYGVSAVGDINGDGRQDVATAFGSGGLQVRTGNSNGTFTVGALLSNNQFDALAIGDFNGDGRGDVVAVDSDESNSYDDRLRPFIQNANGTFTEGASLYLPEFFAGRDVEVVDVNSDAKLDLVVSADFKTSSNGTSSLVLHHGLGNGQFATAVTKSLHWRSGPLATADVNGDQAPDIIVGIKGTPNNPATTGVSVFRSFQQGKAEFSTSTLGAGFHQVTATYNGVTSSAVSHQVKAGTTDPNVSVTVPFTAPLGSTSTLRAEISGSPLATGWVTISVDGSVVAQQALTPSGSFVSGISHVVNWTLPGVHSVSFAYSGDRNYSAETVSRSVNVPKASAHVSLSLTPKGGNYGDEVSLITTVSQDYYNATPTGTVSPQSATGTVTLTPTPGWLARQGFESLPQSANLIAVNGDVTGDGVTDVLAGRGDGDIWLIPSTTTPGQYGTAALAVHIPVSVSSNEWVLDLQVLDVTADGLTDIVGVTGDGFYVAAGHNNGTFSTPVRTALPVRSERTAIGDLSGDGFVDLALLEELPIGSQAVPLVRLYRGSASGQFTSWLTLSGNGAADVAILNVDNVAPRDLLITRRSASVGNSIGMTFTGPTLEVYEGHSTGPKPPKTIVLSTIGSTNPFSFFDMKYARVAVSVMTTGGARRILATTNDGVVHVIARAADGTLTEESSRDLNAGAVAFADVTGDGKTDVLLTDSSSVELALGTTVARAIQTTTSLQPMSQLLIGSSYSGDSTFGAGSSSPVGLWVGRRPIAMSVTTSPSTSFLSQPVTITATAGEPIVSPDPQFVLFSSPAGHLGSAQLVNGVATFQTTAIPAAILPAVDTIVTATLMDDYGAIATVAHHVQQSSSQVLLSASHNPSAAGSPVTFVATVRSAPLGPIPASGTVTFTRSGTALGTVTIVNGVASITVGTLAPGLHSISAAYSGNENYGASSATLAHTVTGGSSCIVSTSPNPSLLGVSVTFTALCPPSSGNVTFNANGVALAGTNTAGQKNPATLGAAAPGMMAVATASLTVGASGVHSMTATNNAGTSAPAQHVVTLPPPTAAIQVTSLLDSGPGTLRNVIASAPQNALIRIGAGGINLESPIVIAGKRLTIEGAGPITTRLNGQLKTRHFVIVGNGNTASDVTIKNLTLHDGFARGGHGGPGNGGGGGGAGMGGSLFIDNPKPGTDPNDPNRTAAIRLQNVTLTSNRAQGGNGGDGVGINDSRDSFWAHGGGGGGGMDRNNGAPGQWCQNLYDQFGVKCERYGEDGEEMAQGGNGGSGGALGGAAGLGDGTDQFKAGGPGAGGGGAATIGSSTSDAGNGGFGGGAGGGAAGSNGTVPDNVPHVAGRGGLGGGSGGWALTEEQARYHGGPGGFGGAGAERGTDCVAFDTGTHCYTMRYTSGGGGGGAGLGGAIFLKSGTLILTEAGFTENFVLGGSGGNTVNGDFGGWGQGKGGAIFVHLGAKLIQNGTNFFAENTSTGKGTGTVCPGTNPLDTDDICGVYSTADGGLHVVTGDLQFTQPGAAFPQSLVLGVIDAGSPVVGLGVSIILPTAGPGARFPDGTTIKTVFTDSFGRASFPAPIANAQVGSFIARVFAGLNEGSPLTLTIQSPRVDVVRVTERFGTPAPLGRTSAFDVTVQRGSPGAPGKLTVLDGVNVLAAQANVADAATLVSSMMGPGLRRVRAVYSGDSSQPPTVSEPWWHYVAAKPSVGLAAPVVLSGITTPGAIAVGSLRGGIDVMVGRSGGPLGIGVGSSTSLSSFAAPAYSPVIQSMALADFDSDGRSDLAMTANISAGAGQLTVLKANANLVLSMATIDSLEPGAKVATSDVNMDGRADIITAASTLQVYLGNGDGTFVKRIIATGVNASDVAVINLNDDTWPDLVLVRQGTANTFLGTGQGFFADPRSAYIGVDAAAAGAISVADFNADGYEDIAVTTPGVSASVGTIAVMLGQPDGSLLGTSSLGVGFVAGDVATSDVNGDGRIDIVAGDRTNNRVVVYHGQGNGSFGAATPSALAGKPVGLIVMDVTFDGTTDVMVTLENNSVAMLAGTIAPDAIVTWGTPAAIPLSTPLGAAQLNATATAPGTFVYEPPAGTYLSTGTHQLSLTYYPSNPDQFPQILTRSLVVTPGSLRIEVADATRHYGDGNPAFESTLSSPLPAGVGFTYVTNATATSSPGQYTIGITLTGQLSLMADYNVEIVPGDLIVTKAPLVVKARDLSTPYGTAPSFAADVTGFRLGQTTNVLGGTLSFVTSPADARPVGSHSIIPSGFVSVNYAISFQPGTLLVTKVPLTVSANSTTRAYGAPNPVFGGTIVGLKYSDTVNVFYDSPAGPTAAAGTLHDIWPNVSGAALANYVLTTTKGTLAIAKASQTINFTKPADPVFDGVGVPLTASASSNLPVAFEVVSGLATVSGSTLTITGAGTIVVRAVQPGDNNYLPATAVDHSFNVTKADQAITFAPLPGRTYLDAASPLSATASSGLTVSFAIVSGPATLAGNTLSLTGAGTVVVRATQTGSAGYNAATPVDRSFDVAKAAQTISFTAPATRPYLSLPFVVGATTSSNLPITLEIVSGPATLAGSTLTMTGAGTVVVRATQSGDANYNAAVPVERSFVVTKAAQTITFPSPGSKVFGAPPFAVNPTASSNLPVDLTLISGPATIDGNTVTITGAGTVTLRATQGGDADYNAATPIDRAVVVSKAAQGITFPPLANRVYGEAPFNLFATVSSQLPVSFSIVSGPATVSGTTLAVTGVGTVTVRAIQPGDANYRASNFVDRSFVVTKGAQTIDFATLPNRTYLDPPFALSATATSGLGVSFALVSGPATLAGNSLTITGSGTVVVRATQQGDANYNAAVPIERSFAVAKAEQTIAFAALPNRTYLDAPFSLSSTSSSGLGVGFAVVSGPATLAGNVLTMTAAGTVVVRATQGGDGNFNAATSVERSFEVAKADQAINFAALANRTYLDAPVDLGATASSGFDVSFAVTSGPATLTGNTLTITGAGTVVVRATQAGDSNYNAAAPVDRSFDVAKADQSVTFGALANVSYGVAPFDLSATAGSAEAVAFAVSGPATLSGTMVTITGAGTVTVTASQPGNANYNAATDVVRTFSVARVPLTVTAFDVARPYGHDVPPYEGVVVGAVNGDTFTTSYSTAAVHNTNVGTYAIVPAINGANIGNYDVTVVNGTLTIEPTALSLVVASATRGYWGAVAYGGEVLGVIGGDNISAVYTSTANASSPAGFYSIVGTLVDPGGRLANYSVSTFPGTLSITNPAPVVTGLTPAAAVAGAPATWIAVAGQDFVPQSVVKWNGVAMTTEFVSRTILRAQVPAANLAAQTVAYVTVTTQGFGGGTSTSAAFYVNPSGTTVLDTETASATNGTASLSVGGTGPGTPGTVTVTAQGSGTISAATFDANPADHLPFRNSGEYFDVYVAPGSNWSSITVTSCGGGSNHVFWFEPRPRPGNPNAGNWVRVTPQTYNASTGCMTMVFSSASTPSIAQLTGTYFSMMTDRVAPHTNVSATAAGSHYVFGAWVNQPVSVALTTEDNVDGVGVESLRTSATGAMTLPSTDHPEGSATIDVNADGETTVTYRALDLAGNEETANTRIIRIDRVRPNASVATSLTELWPANNKLVTVTVTGRFTDDRAGVATAAYRVTDQYGELEPAGPLTLLSDGRFTVPIKLEASRKGTDKNGRVYTITVVGTDRAGNQETATATVLVPHNK